MGTARGIAADGVALGSPPACPCRRGCRARASLTWDLGGSVRDTLASAALVGDLERAS
jgi:hypothetical protein